MRGPIYLDNQATTRTDPRVLEAMLPWFTAGYGNPHSAEHAMGTDAAAAVDRARGQVAALIGAEAREVVLTSGATEANNLAIKGAARHARRHGPDDRRRVITTAADHKCVLESVASLAEDGFEPVVLPVRRDGTVATRALADALRTPTLLVSVIAANNEIGTLADLPALAALTHDAGALFHTDAAQAAGKVPLSVAEVDLLSVSGHKIHGPKGIGALYVRRRPRVRLLPLFSGGGQERGLRSGTVPTPLAVGLGAACAIAAAELAQEAGRIAALRDTLWRGLVTGIAGVTANGSAAHRLPGLLSVTFPAATAAALMAALPDLCVSTGSACTSVEVAPSYVLRAIGLDDDAARRTLRLGLGRFTSRDEIDAAAAALVAAHAALAARA